MISYSLSVITVGIDPTIELGPLTFAWHGLTMAIGILIGGWLASRVAAAAGLDAYRLYEIVMIVAIAGLVGRKVLYLRRQGLTTQ